MSVVTRDTRRVIYSLQYAKQKWLWGEMWSLACTDGNYTKAERVDFYEKMSSLQSFSLFTVADFFTRTTGLVKAERERGKAFHNFLKKVLGDFVLNMNFK